MIQEVTETYTPATMCKVCGAPPKKTQPEASLHAYTIEFTCGASADLPIGSTTIFWHLEKCQKRIEQIEKVTDTKTETDFELKLNYVLDSLRTMLIQKNKSYGDSALNPARIFAKSDSLEQLNVRIDDKLNRIKNKQSYGGDNDELDLIGYLILKQIKLNEEK